VGYIEWVPALSVGIPEIDAQHQKLIALINALEEARKGMQSRERLGAALHALGDYTKEHFALEEKLLTENSYPETREHKAEHALFIERIDAFCAGFESGKAQVDLELLSFLKAWLTRHISFTDKKYRRHLASRPR